MRLEVQPYSIDRDDCTAKMVVSHHLFSPIIAQETFPTNASNTADNREYIYIFCLFPPVRWCRPLLGQGGEGLACLKVRKSDLATINRSFIYHTEDGSVFNLLRLPIRASALLRFKLQPEWGFLKAMFNGSSILLLHIAQKDGSIWKSDLGGYGTTNRPSQYLCYKIYQPSNILSGTRGTLQDFSSDTIDGMILHPRFQCVGDKVYWGATCGGYSLKLGIFYNNKPTLKLHNKYCSWIESFNSDVSKDSRYQQDFCIIENGSQRIACFLGLKAVSTNSANTSDLTPTYGWMKDYISWTPSHLACILYSYPITNDATKQEISPYNASKSGGIDLKTYPQNVIYNTDVERGTGGAVSSANMTSADKYRLYLNTQRFVSYTAASGKTYFIYAYCYPGRTKDLHLGYAKYTVSDNHVRLGIKFEFPPFGKFVSCSRIISMDLQNGHLWITFMDSDSTVYYYFHIKVKDLVGE